MSNRTYYICLTYNAKNCTVTLVLVLESLKKNEELQLIVRNSSQIAKDKLFMRLYAS